MNYEQEFGFHVESSKELTPKESEEFHFLLQDLIGREISFSRGGGTPGETTQSSVDKWVAENASKFEQAFEALKADHPDWIEKSNFINQDKSIEYIGSKMASLRS